MFKSFGDRKVLREVDISLEGGQSLCLCGPNAAGKTTLLRIAAGLVHPDRGRVSVGGVEMDREPGKARAAIGLISHKPMVYPQLTVLENLRFFGRLYGVVDVAGRIEGLLEEAGLVRYRHDCAAVLSRGMIQRLAIARSLVHDPSVLLADEPFTGLDVAAAKYLVTVMSDFVKQGRSVLMTTHNVGLSLDWCDRFAVLDGGRIVFDAAAREIDAARFARDYLAYAREET